ncbi:DUF1848 domain-containing protein [Parablautia muri]|uniref:DUF1848 domain-containing protein n=1 Tax=Parablautia muri TaxID=2320879 RepID=A0A9X5GQK1_9FIRM|nr:DUF1848 domain-containing protein [Parablautia muri]NBJ92333.1 DUF1848 domain-containing protein [Parablautia muri]
MVLNTGSRTDIPAFYSDWFYNRIKEGYVLSRNPYNPIQITQYRLNPEVIDMMVFCTKNPSPMLDGLSMLKAFDMFWFVTITPYGKEIEPYVPPKELVIKYFQELSGKIGKGRVSWRYDPVFITNRYSVGYHIRQFEHMAEELSDYTEQCVVSFIDLYEKTKRNFQGVRRVTKEEQEKLIDAFSKIAKKWGLQIHLCCESTELIRENVDADGCMSRAVLEKALGARLNVPKKKAARNECSCLLGTDIGAYNTCLCGCLYCYANYDRETVLKNRKLHNPFSPLLVGEVSENDVIKQAEQKSWKNGQLDFFDLI